MRFKLRPNFVGISTLFFLLFFAKTSSVYAQWGTGCVVGDVATIKGVECAFANFISVILALAGIVVFIMFLIGGFRYLTSGGDPKALESAKGTLTHAILGLIVLVFAFLILVIIQAVTGVNVTQFRISTD